MIGIFTFIATNGPEILGVLFAIHAAALAIVNLTPTPKDNNVVSKFYRILEIAAGVITRLSKD
jgi:hypothetical protein